MLKSFKNGINSQILLLRILIFTTFDIIKSDKKKFRNIMFHF